MDGLDFPISLLKMNLQCCGDCPLRVKKLLQKVTGVYAITIDPKEGLVLVSGTAEPSVIIKAIEEIGKSPELYAYEKDPKKAKIQYRTLLKRYADDESKDAEAASRSQPSSCDGGGGGCSGKKFDAGSGCGGEIFGGGSPRFLGQPPPFPIPMFTLPPPPRGPPGWLAAGPRPMYTVRYEQPTVTTRKLPPPYPFDFYEPKEIETGNSPFTYFSDQHAQPCNIM